MALPLRIEYPRAEAIFPDNVKLVRQVTIYLSYKCSGMKLREIGERFNLRDTGITETSRRFFRMVEKDKELKARVESLKGSLM